MFVLPLLSGKWVRRDWGNSRLHVWILNHKLVAIVQASFMFICASIIFICNPEKLTGGGADEMVAPLLNFDVKIVAIAYVYSCSLHLHPFSHDPFCETASTFEFEPKIIAVICTSFVFPLFSFVLPPFTPFLDSYCEKASPYKYEPKNSSLGCASFVLDYVFIIPICAPPPHLVEHWHGAEEKGSPTFEF